MATTGFETLTNSDVGRRRETTDERERTDRNFSIQFMPASLRKHTIENNRIMTTLTTHAQLSYSRLL
jgi:hypothetical protein